MTYLFSILGLLVLAFAFIAWHVRVASLHDSYIRSFEFPRGLFEQLKKTHPALTLKDCQLVAAALRQFFLASLKTPDVQLAMPSQVADDLWHEFILHTRNYEQFCSRAFGTFFHHTPAAAMGRGDTSDLALRRCWRAVCREENIHPLRPTRLPLLFAIDSKLHIAAGFFYSVDCEMLRRENAASGAVSTVHCATYFRVADGDSKRDDGGCVGGSGGGDGGGGGGGCSS